MRWTLHTIPLRYHNLWLRLWLCRTFFLLVVHTHLWIISTPRVADCKSTWSKFLSYDRTRIWSLNRFKLRQYYQIDLVVAARSAITKSGSAVIRTHHGKINLDSCPHVGFPFSARILSHLQCPNNRKFVAFEDLLERRKHLQPLKIWVSLRRDRLDFCQDAFELQVF